MLIIQELQAEGLFVNVDAGKSRVNVWPVPSLDEHFAPRWCLTSEGPLCAFWSAPSSHKGAFLMPGPRGGSVGRGHSARRQRPQRAVSCHLTIVFPTLIVSKMVSILHPVPVGDRTGGLETQQPSPPSKVYTCDVTPVTCHVKEQHRWGGDAEMWVAGICACEVGDTQGCGEVCWHKCILK